jgi:N-acetyl-anhydromuramyl-L-alanine amidase AmpD
MKNLTLLALFTCSLLSFSQVKKSVPLNIIDVTAQVKIGYREESQRNIDIIVIHSTCNLGVDSFSVLGVMKQFKEYKVSSHYIIGRNGEIYRMVAENNVAYHAGVSSLPGTNRTNLNTNSIGIEIVNTPNTPPTDEQYESLVHLVQDIKKRYPIKYVVRHSDIAPGRKTDPWMFQWDVFQNFLK